MKSVQKFGSLLLAALMILSLTACGSTKRVADWVSVLGLNG